MKKLKESIPFLLIGLVLLLALGATTHPPMPLPSVGNLPNTFFKPGQPFGPVGYNSTYPATWDVLVGGGFRAWGTSNDMLATPTNWRVAGMAGVISNDLVNLTPYLYVLEPDLITWKKYSLLATNTTGLQSVSNYNDYGSISNSIIAVSSGTVLSITNATAGTITDIYLSPSAMAWTNFANATNTWVKRGGAVEVEVHCIGGGGGGGSGAIANASTSGSPSTNDAYGGGGGGSGGWSMLQFQASELSNSVVVITGHGGLGAVPPVLGVVVVTNIFNSMPGLPGQDGGQSSFGDALYAGGGGGGSGGWFTGTNYSGTNQVGWNGANVQSTNWGGTAGVGFNHPGSPGGDYLSATNYSTYGPGGGGAGGKHLNNDRTSGTGVLQLGFAGGYGPTRYLTLIVGGAPFNNQSTNGAFNALKYSSPGTNYSGPQVNTTNYVPTGVFAFGSGAAGGAASWFTNDVQSGYGGIGSYPGGGGGGGGGGFASDQGVTGYVGYNGYGGPGAPGVVVVITRTGGKADH